MDAPLLEMMTSVPKLVAGWILGIHILNDKSSSLFTRIMGAEPANQYIFNWIGTVFAFEANVYWFESNKMNKKYIRVRG